MKLRWNRVLLKIVTIFGIYTGLTIWRVDLDRRQLKNPNRFIKVYAYFGLLSFFCIQIPFAITTLVKSPPYISNPVANYVNYVTILARMGFSIIAGLNIIKMNKNLPKLLEFMFQMQKFYFDRFQDIAKDTSHRKWLYFNCVIACVHMTIENVIIYVRQEMTDTIIVLTLMNTIQHVCMLHHAALLCYLRECMSVLQQQLSNRHLYPDIQLNVIFAQIQTHKKELNSIYSPVILGIIICFIISNSMVGYTAVVMLMLPELNSDAYAYLFGSYLYILFLIHLYSYFMICTWAEATFRKTNDVLRETQVTVLSMCVGDYDQELELIALSNCLQKPGVNFSGLIDVNSTSLFSIVAQTVSYIITLIQLDYVNLI